MLLGFQPTEIDSTKTVGWVFCAHKIALRTVPEVIQRNDANHSIQALIRKREQDPKRKAALQRARQRLAATLLDHSEDNMSMSSLRLSRGLSQANLAALIGQSQPYIARLEKERQDLRSSTVSKLAKALQVPADTIIELTQPIDENE